MLRQRLILGPILIAGMIAGLALDELLDGLAAPEWLWLLSSDGTLPAGVVVGPVVALASLSATFELWGILRDNGVLASRRVLGVSALAGVATTATVAEGVSGLRGVAVAGTVATGVLIGALAFHSRHRTFEGTVAAAGGALLAFVYLGLMAGLLVAIRREHSAWVLLWVLATTKACDIGAYFSGLAVGHHRLVAWLSPGKTWEGLAGGVLASAGVGAAGLAWFPELAGLSGRGGGAVWGSAAGLAFGLIGQGGDLAASLFKRDAGVKDAGRSLPGFGGVLDVLDSPLLVAPAAYWWLAWVSG